MKTVSKSAFKAHALELFREVEQTGRPLVVTDRGRPGIKVVPFHPDETGGMLALRDTVVRYHASTEPVGEENWEAGSRFSRTRMPGCGGQRTPPACRARRAPPEISFVPVEHRTALRSVLLQDFPHRDPADRIIVATALDLRTALLTGDRGLRAHAPLETVWD